MLGELLVAVSLAMSPGQCTTCGPGGGMEFSPGMAAGSWTAGSGGFSNPYDSVGAGGGGGGDQLYPYDSPEPWLHGYFQEFPAYSGYHTFRPHNYKHVLAQMDVASRWGMSPQMAYSHQWAHRYRQRSGMHPNFGSKAASLDQPDYGNYAQVDPAQMNGSIGAPQQFPTQQTQLQQAAAIERGYTGTPIPGITTPVYQLSRNLRPDPEPQMSEEYISRFESLQKQLEEQTFQMQVLQQQLQDKSQLPDWQQPNHLQFQNQSAPAQQSMAAGGYQELAPPPGSAIQQPALLNVPQANPMAAPVQPYKQENYVVPGYQQDPLQFSYPQQPQGYPQQNYQMSPPQQQGGYSMPQQGGQPDYNPAQPGPILQIPQGQAYFSNQQAMQQMASAQPLTGQNQNYDGQYGTQQYGSQQYGSQQYGSGVTPNQGPIPGMHAAYQQHYGNYPTQQPQQQQQAPQGYAAPQSYPQSNTGYAPRQAAPMQQYSQQQPYPQQQQQFSQQQMGGRP
jgi:hypothetical protein